MMKFWKRIRSLLNKMHDFSFYTFSSNRLRKAFQLSAIFFITGLFLFSSCKKQGDLQPNIIGHGANSSFTDTTTINTGTVRGDSIHTTNTENNIAGRFNDPKFGITDAGIYTQLFLNGSDVDFGDEANLSLDSTILTLKYQNLYGHESSSQTFNVYEMTEALDGESVYYSNTELSVDATPIASHSFSPNLTDSIMVDGSNTAPHLRIPLSSAFGQKILNASGSSDLSSNSNFQEFIKGLYILPDTSVNVSPGNGALLYFELLSAISEVTIYYTNTATSDSKHYVFEINNNVTRVNTFAHDYSGTTIKTLLQDDLSSASESYLQSAAGVKTKIKFPFLNNYTSDKKIAISKAELVIPIDENYDPTYPPPENLILVGINESGESVFLPDNFEGESHYGGSLDKTSNTYTFNITRHIHNIVNTGKKDYGLYLLPSGNAVQGNRVILKSPDNPSAPMKLNLTYTK